MCYDARGMTVVPGFIDCHLHPEGKSLLYDVLSRQSLPRSSS